MKFAYIKVTLFNTLLAPTLVFASSCPSSTTTPVVAAGVGALGMASTLGTYYVLNARRAQLAEQNTALTNQLAQLTANYTQTQQVLEHGLKLLAEAKADISGISASTLTVQSFSTIYQQALDHHNEQCKEHIELIKKNRTETITAKDAEIQRLTTKLARKQSIIKELTNAKLEAAQALTSDGTVIEDLEQRNKELERRLSTQQASSSSQR